MTRSLGAEPPVPPHPMARPAVGSSATFDRRVGSRARLAIPSRVAAYLGSAVRPAGRHAHWASPFPSPSSGARRGAAYACTRTRPARDSSSHVRVRDGSSVETCLRPHQNNRVLMKSDRAKLHGSHFAFRSWCTPSRDPRGHGSETEHADRSATVHAQRRIHEGVQRCVSNCLMRSLRWSSAAPLACLRHARPPKGTRSEHRHTRQEW